MHPERAICDNNVETVKVKGDSPLLRLSPELRNIIYEYVFGGVLHIVRNESKTYISFRVLSCHSPAVEFLPVSPTAKTSYYATSRNHTTESEIYADPNRVSTAASEVERRQTCCYGAKHPHCYELLALEDDTSLRDQMQEFHLFQAEKCCGYPLTSIQAMCAKHVRMWDSRHCLLHEFSRSRPHIALTRTCRQIHAETRTLPLAMPALDFFDISHVAVFLQHFVSTDQALLITSLQLKECTSRQLAKAKVLLPGLKKLVVSDPMTSDTDPAPSESILELELRDVVHGVQKELTACEFERPLAVEAKVTWTEGYCARMRGGADERMTELASEMLERHFMALGPGEGKLEEAKWRWVEEAKTRAEETGMDGGTQSPETTEGDVTTMDLF